MKEQMIMERLEDLADVIVGQIMTRVSSKDGEGKDIRVLVPGAVGRGYIQEKSLGTNNIIKKLDDKFISKAGDIVMKLTAEYDAAMIDESQTGIAISSFICVIRAKDRIDSRYLCAVLNSEYAKSKLRSKAEGAIRPMLKASDIKGLEIPLIGREEQENIGKAFELSIRKRCLLQEMIKTETDIMEAIVNNAIMEEITHE